MNFVKNLNIATALEKFMATTNEKSENILSTLVKADPKEWNTLETFGKLIENYCKDYKTPGSSVCDKNFKLTED